MTPCRKVMALTLVIELFAAVRAVQFYRANPHG
jgi:hypothetical protein